MWVLINKNGNTFHLLTEKEKYTVGRAASDLPLTGDTSISRTHACLFPTKDCVKVIDIGSKYGTFHNVNIQKNIPLEKNVSIDLQDGEKIRFGMLENEWTLNRLQICTNISRIDQQQKIELRKILQLLDGRLVDNWETACTHLTMPDITVTQKLLHALVTCIPIVSLDFWCNYLKNLRDGKQPPNPDDFLPKNSETYLGVGCSFRVVSNRKSLFAGKTFVFFSRTTLDAYGPIVKSGGAKFKGLHEGVSKQLLKKKEVIVVRGNSGQTQSQSLQTVANDLHDYLRSIGRRTIPESEIGLAIIHCSTEKYCNPDYDMVKRFVAETDEIIPNSDIIAKNTPHLGIEQQSEKSSIEIPDSDLHDLEIPGKVRPAVQDVSIVEIDCTEKFEGVVAVQADSSELINSGKRKRTELDDRQTKKLHSESTEPTSVSSDDMSGNLLIVTSNDTSSVEPPPGPSTSSAHSVRKSVNEFIDPSLSKRRIQRSVQLTESPGNLETRKRSRIADICENDDGDDLFAFSKTKKSKPIENKENTEEEQVFTWQNTPKTRQTQKEKTNPADSNSNNSITNGKTKEPAFKRPPKEKIIIPTEGWLSKSMSSVKIKADVKDDTTGSLESSTINSSWFNSLKGGFEVRIRSMQLVPKIARSTASQPGPSSTGNVKNFKAFVKKCNYKPQTTVISTVPVHVGLKMD